MKQVPAVVDLAVVVDRSPIDLQSVLLDHTLSIAASLPETRLNDQARISDDAASALICLNLHLLCIGEVISKLTLTHRED